MKNGTRLKLTQRALKEFPEYRGATLTYLKNIKLNGTSYIGYKVKINHQKPFIEDWAKMWFEDNITTKRKKSNEQA